LPTGKVGGTDASRHHDAPGKGSSACLAVVFDVDGTLVDSERDGHRVAFNRAFEELGLPDRWDEDVYGELLSVTGGQRRLHRWLERRGMPQAERDELVPRLHARKTELFTELAAGGAVPVRSGAPELIAELGERNVRMAVATTGSRDWVEPLLDRLFGLDPFEVLVTGDEVSDRKPDPHAYHLALERLALGPSGVLAVEDSEPGLEAAEGAELGCVVVVNDYTRDHDLKAADLVLDGFGTVEDPAAVLHDPHGVHPPGRVDLATLERVVRARSGA
jgi:HAD superfamily hydrolase (TIGR01509 family)